MVLPFNKHIDQLTYTNMLLYEQKLRLSKFIQSMFRGKNTTDSIIDLVQKIVLDKFGFDNSVQSLENYRSAIKNFDRKDFNVFWIKNNIIDFPTFEVGDYCPSSYLYTENKNVIKFPDDFLNHKPLVVIASSDSWPPVLRDIQEIDIYARSNHSYNFLFVYIIQAHSEDWPIGEWSNKKQPFTIEERIDRGKEFAKEYDIQMPMVFDKMNNNFNSKMAAWPLRFYILNKRGCLAVTHKIRNCMKLWFKE